MKKVTTQILMLISFCLSVSAQTDHSKLVSYVQKNYADKFKDYPILIFDIDELEERFLKENALGKEEENEDKRAEIIIQYVYERTGITLRHQQASGIEPYTYILKGGAYALPVKERYGSKKITFCGVFPASPNGNQKLEIERLMSYESSPEHYEGADFHHLKEKMTFKEMQYFSLFHEVAHCMDRKYFPEALNSYEPTGHDVHQSESFAESMALLFMEREGMTGTGKKRIWLRNLVASKMGPWFYENRNLAYGDRLFEQFGSIYWLVPSLTGANKYVADYSEETKLKSIDELLGVGINIVDTHSYPHRSFHAVYQYQVKKDQAVEDYKELAENSPDYFEKAYEDLLSYIELSGQLIKDALFKNPHGLGDEAESMQRLDTNELCRLYSKDNKEVFWAKVQQWRQYLIDTPVSSNRSEQISLRDDLNQLFSKLNSCP